MDKRIQKLFVTSWVIYFISYIGRLNYAASMLEIGITEGYSKSQLGAVVTALFISYGIGQLISGFLGDRFSPKPLVTIGLCVSAICNLFIFSSNAYWQLLAVWFVNGFAMSLLWSPILKVFTLYMPKDYLHQCCFKIQSSVALGTCCTYVLASTLLIRFNWRMIFLVASILLICACILWNRLLADLEAHVTPIQYEPVTPEESAARAATLTVDFKEVFLKSGLPCMLIAILMMGILKDGIMTWIPQMITDTFAVNSSFSILLSALLPLVNLIGIWAAKRLYERNGQNDIKTSAVLYVASLISLILLTTFGTKQLIMCLILFAIVTSSMLGINTILVSVLPTYFAPYNKVSTVAGILNSTMYLGSALCGYGLGRFTDSFGWTQTLWLLVGFAALGLLTCLLPTKPWRAFKKSH
ncbi:MAG: MFS transporter [Cellulosilyticaceae bacterium]